MCTRHTDIKKKCRMLLQKHAYRKRQSSLSNGKEPGCTVVLRGRCNSRLAKEISKQTIEGTAWFFLTAYSKMQKERTELKKELLSKKRSQNLKIWKIFSLFILQKMKKLVLKRTLRLWLNNHLVESGTQSAISTETRQKDGIIQQTLPV